MVFYLVYFFLSPFLFLLIHIIKFFNLKIYNHIKYEKESFYNVLNSISIKDLIEAILRVRKRRHEREQNTGK